MSKAETDTESAPESTNAPPFPKRKTGRPPKGEDRIPRVLSFFDRMAAIPKEDWGTRARIKIYRTEPHIDRVSLGKKRYVKDCMEPIDEDTIKRAAWGGSGAYRLYLTFKEPTAREGKEIDSMDLDILDTQYPPRLEAGEWLDIPENAKWKWAKSLLEPPPVPVQTPMSSIVEVMNATNEIRRNALEEMRQATPPPPPPPPPQENPMAAALAIAKDLLTIRADNPMVTLMSEQVAALRAELADQRKEAARLMERLTEKNEKAATTDPLASVKAIFDTFRSVREQAADVMPSSGGGRSRLSPWMEFFQPVLPGIMDMLKPVMVAVAQQSMAPNPAAPHLRPQVPDAAPPPQQRDFAAFLDIITPRMLHFLRDYEDAAPEFAAWLHDGWGATAQRATDTIASMGGAPALMAWYRTSKYWPSIALIEADFTKFIGDVLAWKPETDSADETAAAAPTDATEQPIIDLEAEPVEAN